MDHPVKHIDHIMWDMEMPTSLVTVVGMMIFKEKVECDEIRHIVENRLLQYEKFKQKIILKKNKPYWHDDEEFDIHAHVGHVALPEPGDYAALQEMVGYLMAIPLDYSKPLWKVHLIDNYNGGSAVIWRIHHAIADGIGLIKVVFSLTGDTVEESRREMHFIAEGKSDKEDFILDRLKSKLDHYIHLGEDLYNEAKHLIREPGVLRDALQESWETTRELARMVTDRSRKDSIYKGHLGVTKMVAWSRSVSLPMIKKAGKSHGATVNDVLLALMTGAIRKHLMKHDESPDEHFRVVCPVNIRQDGMIRVDNQIGMISLKLPVYLADLHERIKVINKRTTKLKHSMEPAAVYTILNIAGDYLPKKLEIKAAEFIGERIMGVLSNVPGPQNSVYFCGKMVDDIMFWIPQTNALGIGISIFSYDNKVSVGVATDAHVIDDPDFIIDAFLAEYQSMKDSLLGIDQEACND
jgi:WS/DGAT/MGAT family acyltransferase